jgi:hypothetical protein
VEVKKVPCFPDQQNFKTEVEVMIKSIALLSANAVKMLTEDFLRTYNELMQRYCDPYFREILEAEVVNQVSRKVRGRSLQLNSQNVIRKKITGVCKSCPINSKIYTVSLFSDRPECSTNTSSRFEI